VEFAGGDRLAIACTQTNLPARQQRALVDEWCELLPKLSEVRFLWFSSRVSQELFDAACRIPQLEGLYIKWSGISDLSSLGYAQSVRYFHLGQSAKVESIEPLARCLNLQWLGLELLSRIRDLDPLGRLQDLEGLSLEGSMGTSWRVQSLAPLGLLTNLRYLSIANVRADDRSLASLQSLTKLRTFLHATWWNTAELNEIKRRNPELAS